MTSHGGPSGSPLDEYTASTPPGWKPYMDGYPLMLYTDKLTMWMKAYNPSNDLEKHAMACVLVAGRLKGNANTIAMKLRMKEELKKSIWYGRRRSSHGCLGQVLRFPSW